ncbi:ABC transporter transmembrane domain-containing protein [Vibrio sp. 10N]|uniref:ABC transporter transmembrane domain-containing protein n=1 Tax=Vibrio sp. 10N TaxID=3058938 RepID=UPI002813C234|nr:ABC transporter transmembrane domain-containing protein [Vibrio sp. 10N]
METTLSAGVSGIRKVLIPSILINILSLAVPLTVLQIYDRIIPNQSYGTATLLLLGATLAVLLDALLRYIRSWILAAESANMEKARYASAVRVLASAPTAEIKQLKVGGVQNGLESISKIKDIYSGGLLSGLIDIPFALLFLFLIYYVGGALVLVPFIVWTVTFLIVWQSGNRAKRRSQKHAELDDLRAGFLVKLSRNLLGIKRQASEYRTFSTFKKLNQRYRLITADDERKNAFAQECIYLASLGTSVVLVIAGASHVLSGEMTTGGLAACSILAGRAVAPLTALTNLNIRYANMQTSVQSVRELLTLSAQKESLPDNIESFRQIAYHDIEFDRYGKTYSFSHELVCGRIALVEHRNNEVSGQALAAMAGVNTIADGKVLIDDLTVDPHSIASITSYISARGSILQGSILDNLCGFNPELSEKALSYSKQLGLYDVLTQLPDGLETKLAQLPTIPLSHSSMRLINLCFQLAKPTPLLFIDKPEIDLDIDTWPKLAAVLESEASSGRSIALVTHNPLFKQLTSDVISVSEGMAGERGESNE